MVALRGNWTMVKPFNFEVVPIDEVMQRSGVSTLKDPPTLLVVDDERLIADSLSAILRRWGFTVVTAYSGETALAESQRVSPGLLITDVAMPGMDGISLAMAVSDAVPECKVLLFSGHAATLDLAPARAKGYDFPLLAKPVHPKTMLEQVFSCLDGDFVAA